MDEMDEINEIVAKLRADGDFPSAFDGLQFSNNLEIDESNGDPYDILLWLELNNDDHGGDGTIVGDTTIELTHLIAETQTDGLAILHKEQLLQDPPADGTPEIVNTPIAQQAAGSTNGIMYSIFPSLFNIIIGVMSVIQQPKANNRARYARDGLRFLPDSRHHPMAVQLPNLKAIQLHSNQTLGIVMTMVTDTNNLMNQTLLHENDLICDEAGAEKIGHGCVFAPLKSSEIDAGVKKFPRMSIIYKKYEEYTFNLTSFDINTMFETIGTFAVPNEPNMARVPKGKLFKKEYDLLSYKIIFHLALKEDNIIYISNIVCETDVIHEQMTTSQSCKRPPSSATEHILVSDDGDSSYDIQASNAPKRFKSSSPSPSSSVLPVTRVENRDI